jgi:rRNA maturation endonuclease Nob1
VDKAATLAQVKAESAAKDVELAELKKKLRLVEEAYARLQTSHIELQTKAGIKEKKPYVYRDDECRGVHEGEVCPQCGYDNRRMIDDQRNPRFQMKTGDNHKSAHPIL